MLPAAAPRAGIPVSRQRETGRTTGTAPARWNPETPMRSPSASVVYQRIGSAQSAREQLDAGPERNCFRGNAPTVGALVPQAQRAMPKRISADKAVSAGGS